MANITINETDEVASVDGLAKPDPKLNYFQKLWRYRKYLVIEPIYFFVFMGPTLISIAIKNFPFEKACRVNLGYNKDVCTSIIDKSELGIHCDVFNFKNTTKGALPEDVYLTKYEPRFNYTVCKAEVETQGLYAGVSGTRASIGAIFELIVILFASGWSDRYNKRKSCMILPIIGDMISCCCLIFSSIFFDTIPMEFGAYCEGIVPSLFGGTFLFISAVFSYVAITTPEQDRTFRFGILTMFYNCITFIGTPLSGYSFRALGYTASYGLAIVFEIFAVLYIIFVLKDIKSEPKPDASPTSNEPTLSQAADNLGYDATNSNELNVNKNVNFELRPRVDPPVTKQDPPKIDVSPPRGSLLWELFDPTLIIDYIKFPLVKRKNNGQLLLNLLITAYFLVAGPVLGESEYWYGYTLKKFNWSANEFNSYKTVTEILTMIGTLIGTTVLSKMLKFSDSAIGILASSTNVVSRVLFAYAVNTITFYVGGVVDMLDALRAITIKSIGSNIVDAEEFGKLHSIFGIVTPITGFIFPPIYSQIYQKYLNSFPGAYFLFGEIFYVPNIIIFILCYFLLRRQKTKGKSNAKELSQNVNRNENSNPDTEITNL